MSRFFMVHCVGLIIILASVLCLNVVWHNFVIFARYWDLGDIFLH